MAIFSFTDNFESYSVPVDLNGGSGGSGWSAAWSGDALFDAVSTDSPYEGSKHVKASPTVDAFRAISRTFTAVTATGIIKCAVKINRTGGTSGKSIRGDINVYNGATQVGRLFIQISDSIAKAEILTNDGAAWIQLSGTIVNNTYHIFEIEYDNASQANKYRARFDGGTWTSWYGYIGSPTWSQITKVEFDTSSADGGAAGSMYWDDLNPQSASGPANLKSYNTNVLANIKSINTNLIANVKSLDTNV